MARLKVKKVKKKDKNAPKKAKTAFIFFSSDFRPILKEQNPEYTFSQLAKELGNRWKKMKPQEKKKYEDNAVKDKKRYEKEKKDYDAKKKQEAGEEEENDDQQEDDQEEEEEEKDAKADDDNSASNSGGQVDNNGQGGNMAGSVVDNSADTSTASVASGAD